MDGSRHAHTHTQTHTQKQATRTQTHTHTHRSKHAHTQKHCLSDRLCDDKNTLFIILHIKKLVGVLGPCLNSCVMSSLNRSVMRHAVPLLNLWRTKTDKSAITVASLSQGAGEGLRVGEMLNIMQCSSTPRIRAARSTAHTITSTEAPCCRTCSG